MRILKNIYIHCFHPRPLFLLLTLVLFSRRCLCTYVKVYRLPGGFGLGDFCGTQLASRKIPWEQRRAKSPTSDLSNGSEKEGAGMKKRRFRRPELENVICRRVPPIPPHSHSPPSPWRSNSATVLKKEGMARRLLRVAKWNILQGYQPTCLSACLSCKSTEIKLRDEWDRIIITGTITGKIGIDGTEIFSPQVELKCGRGWKIFPQSWITVTKLQHGWENWLH